jgi:hypothetical protein
VAEQPRPARRGRRGFFGREHELRELHAAMDETAAGYGRLMLVAGEPGTFVVYDPDPAVSISWAV